MSESDQSGINRLNGKRHVTKISNFNPHVRPLDLSLSLAVGGQDQTSGSLARSISLASSLAMNERLPPPPRDFLSLSRSCSLPINPRSQPRTARGWPILPHPPMRPMHQQPVAVQPPQPHLNHKWRVPHLILPRGPPPPAAYHRHQQPPPPPPPPSPQQTVLSVPPLPQRGLPAISQPNIMAAFAFPAANPALCRALNYIASHGGQSSGTTNIFTSPEGSSTSAQPDPARYTTRPTNSRGKRPLDPTEDFDVQEEPESVAKRMQLMQEKGREDSHRVMWEMPGVSAFGFLEPGKRTEGFLYRYLDGRVGIVCNCHGTFLSPAEFVEHAGGVGVENPMKHIMVNLFQQ